MARQYSPRHFLRQTSNVLLQRYFHEQGLLVELDIAKLPETDIEKVYEGWQALPEQRRAKVDADFTTVSSLGDGEGVATLMEEGRFQGVDLLPQFAKLGGSHDKALWTLLEHPRCVEVASRFREADELPRRYWRNRTEGIPDKQPRDDLEACEELAQTLGAYFRMKEGRGQACHVDPYKRGEKFYFFCYPEDHGREQLEFQEGKLQRRATRPVFEVIFVYAPTEESLDTFFEGPKDRVADLQQIFGSTILQVEIARLDKDERVYNLNRFKDRRLQFKYDPAAGIRDVRIKELRLSVMGATNERLTAEADPSRDRLAVYKFLDKLLEVGTPTSDGSRIPLAVTHVTRVGIQVLFAKDGRRGRPTRTFHLSYPNGCTLRHDGNDAALRRMLIDSGIQPTRPSAEKSA